MILAKSYRNSPEVPHVTGLGSGAWNDGTSEMVVPSPVVGDESRIIRINHEERKAAVARNNAVEAVDSRRFDASANPGISGTVHLPVIASLVTLAVLGLAA